MYLLSTDTRGRGLIVSFARIHRRKSSEFLEIRAPYDPTVNRWFVHLDPNPTSCWWPAWGRRGRYPIHPPPGLESEYFSRPKWNPTTPRRHSPNLIRFSWFSKMARYLEVLDFGFSTSSRIRVASIPWPFPLHRESDFLHRDGVTKAGIKQLPIRQDGGETYVSY